MKPNTSNKLITEGLRNALAALGFEVLYVPKSKSANGVDLWVQKDGGRPISVEIKKAFKKLKNVYQVDPVSQNATHNDLIAVLCGEKYALVHPMKEHLKLCGPKGCRQLTLLLGKNP